MEIEDSLKCFRQHFHFNIYIENKYMLIYLFFRELRFLIHQSIAGGVIGKGGEKIKEIRQTTGAGVKVQFSFTRSDKLLEQELRYSFHLPLIKEIRQTTGAGVKVQFSFTID